MPPSGGASGKSNSVRFSSDNRRHLSKALNTQLRSCKQRMKERRGSTVYGCLVLNRERGAPLRPQRLWRRRYGMRGAGVRCSWLRPCLPGKAGHPALPCGMVQVGPGKAPFCRVTRSLMEGVLVCYSTFGTAQLELLSGTAIYASDALESVMSTEGLLLR